MVIDDIPIFSEYGINICVKYTYKHFVNPFSTKCCRRTIIQVCSEEIAFKNYCDWLYGIDFKLIQMQQKLWIQKQLLSSYSKFNVLLNTGKPIIFCEDRFERYADFLLNFDKTKFHG